MMYKGNQCHSTHTQPGKIGWVIQCQYQELLTVGSLAMFLKYSSIVQSIAANYELGIVAVGARKELTI